ncbi:hypothetical protein B0O99DRAFT_610890 [Bisporella sp. PMI_857]|nr:hypothetical protein B0O99DRAFT_612317 [Bisporella sp. PMI_857]KAH8600535.1 hypothetical protein B0O99DRAFT_610890 [Bisporella sp. PMI_857]
MVDPHIYPGTQIFRYDHMPVTGQTGQNQSMGSIEPRPMGWVPIPLPSMHYQQPPKTYQSPPIYCNQPVNIQPVCYTGPDSVPHHLVHQHMGFSGGREAMNDPQQGQTSGNILLAASDLQNLDPRLLVDSDQQIWAAIGGEEINTTHQRIARAILQQEFSKNAGTTGTSSTLERLSPELTPPTESPETKSPSISRAEAIIKDIDAAGGFEAWLSAGTLSSPPNSDGEGGGATPPEAPDSKEQEDEADQALAAMVAADLAAAMTPGSVFGPNGDAYFNNFCKECFELMDSAL